MIIVQKWDLNYHKITTLEPVFVWILWCMYMYTYYGKSRTHLNSIVFRSSRSDVNINLSWILSELFPLYVRGYVSVSHVNLIIVLLNTFVFRYFFCIRKLSIHLFEKVTFRQKIAFQKKETFSWQHSSWGVELDSNQYLEPQAFCCRVYRKWMIFEISDN